MSALLHRVGAFSARNWKLVIPVWIVATVALVLIANSAGRETNDDLTLPGTGSTEAHNLLDKKLPDQANGSVPIVFETKSGTLTSGANKQAVEDAVKSARRQPERPVRRQPVLRAGRGPDQPRTARSSTRRSP